MDLNPRCLQKIGHLINKGVDIPNPLTLDIGDEVNTEWISAQDVRIYPGCRIYGEHTVISSGARIGSEGPVTIENCRVGRNVELKGGYFSSSVFLDGSNMGSGAHVREGCILEEEAGGAHCVGLKQTILFPFVTLGSLVNFCDCLMAGGTSRKDHSEVGSSYIHFNFTPDGDKTTPSLLGDVPRGVMLNQPPIFLGGQGGIVGPLRLGFGNVVAAGSILREDIPDENQLIVGENRTGGVRPYLRALYPDLSRILENNILYLANLSALRAWYIHVRKSFLDPCEYGGLIHKGLLDMLSLAVKERVGRLEAMAARAQNADHFPSERDARLRKGLLKSMREVRALFLEGEDEDAEARAVREDFLSGLHASMHAGAGSYVETIQGLSPEVTGKGSKWLESVVARCCRMASAAMAGLHG